jgi:hypothetical protein
MPCKCKPEHIEYPEPTEWGPPFWMILHGLASRTGTVAIALLQPDDVRAWTAFLKYTGKAIPCPHCREHYSSWVQENPINPPKSYELFGDWVRDWLWRLHNQVNSRLGKPFFPKESLRETYLHPMISDSINKLEAMEKRAIQLSGVSLLAWKDWINKLRLIRSNYGI